MYGAGRPWATSSLQIAAAKYFSHPSRRKIGRRRELLQGLSSGKLHAGLSRYDGMHPGTRMRKLHLTIGVLTLIAFVITGQIIRHHTPPMRTLSDGVRLMYRSRHIYIL